MYAAAAVAVAAAAEVVGAAAAARVGAAAAARVGAAAAEGVGAAAAEVVDAVAAAMVGSAAAGAGTARDASCTPYERRSPVAVGLDSTPRGPTHPPPPPGPPPAQSHIAPEIEANIALISIHCLISECISYAIGSDSIFIIYVPLDLDG
jgi:hypothetical protein